VFDVFGTVVDWRSSVITEATILGQAKGLPTFGKWLLVPCHSDERQRGDDLFLFAGEKRVIRPPSDNAADTVCFDKDGTSSPALYGIGVLLRKRGRNRRRSNYSYLDPAFSTVKQK